MLDLKLDLDSDVWDLAIAGGDLQFVTGDAELIQHVGILLRTILGEWFQDPTLGFIDKKRFFGKNASESYFRAKLIAKVESDEQIAKGSAVIESLVTNSAAHNRTCTWSARRVNGNPLRGRVTMRLA